MLKIYLCIYLKKIVIFIASISLVRVFRNILIASVRMTLEIRYGNGKKQKGKNTMKEKIELKKLQVAPPRDLNLHTNFLQRKM